MEKVSLEFDSLVTLNPKVLSDGLCQKLYRHQILHPTPLHFGLEILHPTPLHSGPSNPNPLTDAVCQGVGQCAVVRGNCGEALLGLEGCTR